MTTQPRVSHELVRTFEREISAVLEAGAQTGVLQKQEPHFIEIMMYMLRKVPRPTDSVKYEGMRFEVLEVDHYRIDQLLAKRAGHGEASPAFAAANSD